MSDLSLEKLDAVCAAIETATTVQEIKHTLDLANAAAIYAQQAKVGKEIELKAAEYVVRAERKLGELLQAAKAAGQIGEGKPFQKHTVDGDDSKVRLSEIGISRDLSSRAQRIAQVPVDEFERAINDAKATGKLPKSVFTKNSKPPHAPKSHPAKSEIAQPEITRDMVRAASRQQFGEVYKLRAEIGKLKNDILKLKAALQEEPDAAKLRQKVVDQQAEMASMRRAMKRIAEERDKRERHTTPEYREAQRSLTAQNYRVLIKALHFDRRKQISSIELAEAERIAISLRAVFIER